MRRSLLALTCLTGIIAFAGCGQSNTQGSAVPPPGGQEAMTRRQPGGPPPEAEGAPTAGSNELFSTHCGKCHSVAAAGSEPMKKSPNLGKVGADSAHTVEWISEHIRSPKTHKPESNMPAFAEKLKPEEIKAIAEYLAGLK